MQCFIYHSLSFCQLPFGHYIVCLLSVSLWPRHCLVFFMYGFWLPRWYLKTLLALLRNYLPVMCFFKVSKFTCTDILREFNIRWCSSRITGKRRMPLVEQIFHIPHHPGHLSSPLPCSLYSSSCSIFSFLSNILYITVCPFVSFPLAMILSAFFYVRLLVTSLISSNLSCTLTKLAYAR